MFAPVLQRSGQTAKAISSKKFWGDNGMNIDSAVLDVLSNATMSGNSLKLTGQLNRPLYVITNKVLEAAGGKWNRKAQAHVFDGDAAEIMDQIILTGKVLNKKQELGYFPTPPAVVKRLLELAQIEPGMRVLEPSAGTGNILKAIIPSADKVAVEVNPEFIPKLALCGSGILVVEGDFLAIPNARLRPFDRVVMNPPFAPRQADIRHVNHALTFLKPGGRLVSVMSSSVTFRTNALTDSFRFRLPGFKGTIEALPENAFAESGTNVNTVIVTMQN
jgi:phospholipid N-methyltransferase